MKPTESPMPAPRQLAICLASRVAWRLLLVDEQGQLVGSPEGFLTIRGFNSPPIDGVLFSAAQAVDGRWGFIDTAGQWRVPAQYEDTRNAAANGMARFRHNGCWGYTRMDGHVVIEPRFEEARAFRHGVAAVKLPGKGWRFIDEAGEFTSRKEHDELGDMGQSGLAWASRREWAVKGGRRLVGFVDREGRWVIEPTFGYAQPFGDHAVTAATESHQHYGLIDTRGQWVLAPQKDWRIEAFDEDGLASFHVSSGNYERGFINLQGDVCIPTGRNVGRHRSCGLARAWTQYYRADGERVEPAARLCMASDFRPEAQVAIVRLDQVKAHGEQPAQARNWALLHTDGRVVPVPADLREPLSNADDTMLSENPDTPWVCFIGHEGDLVWVDGECQEQARVKMRNGQASLHTAAGQVWATSAEGMGPVLPYYIPSTEQMLEGIAAPIDVTPLAEQLRDLIEARLHQAAAGQTLEPMAGLPNDEDDDDWDDEDEDDGVAEGENATDALAPDWRSLRRQTRQMEKLLRAERRLSRLYLGEEHGADDEFLTTEWSDRSQRLHEELQSVLTARFGSPVAYPEWAGWQHSGLKPMGWAVNLSQALPGDNGQVSEHRQLWICLHHVNESGDGDVWWENWLLVAPSVDALCMAMRARAGQPGVPPAPDEAAAIDLVSRHPDALQTLPREHLSDGIIDAALQASSWTIPMVPKRLMTADRYALALADGRLGFSEVPAEQLTPSVCKAYVQRHGWGLRDIPEHLRTAEVCLQAMQSSPSVRELVPPAIIEALIESGVDVPDPARRAAELKASLQEVTARAEKLLADPFIQLVNERPTKPRQRISHAFRLGSFVLQRMVLAKTQEPAEHRGLTGWLERRPVMAVMSNAVMSILAILCHVLVVIDAWQLEGWMAATATALFFGLAELYWIWRAFVGDTPDMSLGLVAAVPVLYMAVWLPLYQRIARVYAKREGLLADT